MIRLGFGIREKEKVINQYIKENDIKKLFVLYAKETEQKLKLDLDYKAIEYNEWEMYRTFYPMIEEVDDTSLIVVNEALRTTTYQDLKVNCATVWLNQTPHRIIFNFLPFIDEKEDFRILQKLDQGSKWVDEFDYKQLQSQDILVKPIKIKTNIINVDTTEKEKNSYENYKEKLLAEVKENVSKDPNIIPRRLQLKAGDYKKKALNSETLYLARNQRFKLDNVYSLKSYDKKNKYHFIDLPVTNKELIDYIFLSKNYTINYLATDLSIDTFLVNELISWKARIDAFYVKANLYK